MINNELIEKIQSDEDGRIYYIKVTERGRKIIEGDNAVYLQFTSLISEIISFAVIDFVISISPTLIIISPHFNPAFSAGLPESGEIILSSPGLSISTCAPIHSNSPFKPS